MIFDDDWIQAFIPAATILLIPISLTFIYFFNHILPLREHSNEKKEESASKSKIIQVPVPVAPLSIEKNNSPNENHKEDSHKTPIPPTINKEISQTIKNESTFEKETFKMLEKCETKSETEAKTNIVIDKEDSDNQWRCVCSTSFLPPSMLKTFGGAEAIMRFGSGQCYHTK